MQFQGIVLRIIVQILMSGAPTGELPGGVWRRPQGAVKRCRRGSLNTSSSFENPQSDSLKFHAFSTFLPIFGVQNSCMGSLFFYPTPQHWKPLHNLMHLLTSRKHFHPKYTPGPKFSPAPPTMLKSAVPRPKLLWDASIFDRYAPPVYI